MKCISTLTKMALGALAFYGATSTLVAAEDKLDRTVLPIPEPKPPLYTELDARNVSPPPRFQVKAPEGAPNVLIVLIDDMGFGQSSAFGGPVHMPTVEALANEGLRFNQFHTTALCSPTRTALLSGRNHHMNNMGGDHRGRDRLSRQHRPDTERVLRHSPRCCASMATRPPISARAMRLRRGRSAYPARPTAGRRAEASTNSMASSAARRTSGTPLIYEDMTRVEPTHDPGYHFMTDMTDHAIAWVQAEKSLTPGQAILHLFRAGRDACAASGAEGMDREI